MENEAVSVPVNDENEETIGGLALSRQISGPLPSSVELQGYEKTLPGSAERILAIWEKEVAQRHENEKTVIRETFRLSSMGQTCGLITILVCAGLILTSVFLKQPLMAIPAAIIALAGMATVFFGKK